MGVEMSLEAVYVRNGHGARRGTAWGVRDEPGGRPRVVGQGPVGTRGWGSWCTVGRVGHGLAVGGRRFRFKDDLWDG